MFAAVASLAVRIAPVAVRVVTHPKVITGAVQVVGISLVSVGIRAAKLQGEDKVGQFHAEAVQVQRDPVGFPDEPFRVAGFKQRFNRNLYLLGMGFAQEGRTLRLLVTPPTHLACFLRVKAAQRRYDRLVTKLGTPTDALEVPAGMEKLGAKIEKAYKHYGKRYTKLENVRGVKGTGFKGWYQVTRCTPGEIYLAEQLGLLNTEAASREVRTDTVEAIYMRSLDSAIDLSSIDMTNPHDAGAAVFVAVSLNFKGDELPLIRARVLKSWLYKKHSLSQSQWHKFTQGWADASSVAQSV